VASRSPDCALRTNSASGVSAAVVIRTTVAAAVREVERVTRPGGVMVSLDFFLPANRVLRRLFLSYLYIQGFFWGYVLHGRPRVYTYIPDSLRSFVSIDEFSRLLGNSGYDRVNARGFLLGGIGLHWAAKAQ
jgi:demethylmenaquinone methyltransferase/2-methoxy-6-polyprenyl-1,4-benzoquinol methylase